MAFELEYEWLHVAYAEPAAFTETYGFVGSQGKVNLEGVLIRPRGVPSRTLQIFMHPASTLQLLPVPQENVRRGAHVLCAGSRYARNDTAAILEKVLLDLGAYIRHAREVLGYEKIVLVGWSGGGSLSLFYQAEAEQPTITATPAGDPVDIVNAGLIPADAVVFQAAHISRAVLLQDSLDPSIRNEFDPDHRDPGMDIYDPRNPSRPPYSELFLTEYRLAQMRRMRRITAWVKGELARLAESRSGEIERGFITHRTLADPRWLDPAVEPNNRAPGQSYLGDPRVVNNGPVGLARFSTLRAWLSQWSVEDSRADGVRNAARISAPLLAIENGADDAVPQQHVPRVFAAAASMDKQFARIEQANHYYAGQPDQMNEAASLIDRWLLDRGLAGAGQ